MDTETEKNKKKNISGTQIKGTGCIIQKIPISFISFWFHVRKKKNK